MPLYDHWPDVEACAICGVLLDANAAQCPNCGQAHYDRRVEIKTLDLDAANKRAMHSTREDAIRWARAGAMPYLNRGDFRRAFDVFAAELMPYATSDDREQLDEGVLLLTFCDPLTILSEMRRFIVEYK
jgi:TPP-dependent pyruvate/acetoin dehydrogenase alpha subunit